MTESDIKVLRDDLKDDIHRFSMVPDLSDESFGNNLSGVAIKYKLVDLNLILDIIILLIILDIIRYIKK